MASTIPDLSHELHVLQQRVDTLDGEVQQLRVEVAGAASGGVGWQRLRDLSPEFLQTAKDVAAELGFQVGDLETVSDPESVADVFYVLNVRAHGTPRELFDLRMRWHERLCAIDQSYIGLLRLGVYPL
jgi:hypothetical protein